MESTPTHIRSFSSLAASVALLASGWFAEPAHASPPGPFPRLRAAYTTEKDSYATKPMLPHVLQIDEIAPDFCYEAPGTFTEFANGTARLTGIVRSGVNPSLRLILDLQLSSRLVFGDPGFHPPGSPVLQLDPLAYSIGGGPVNIDDLYYYTNLTGRLYGLDALAGAVIDVTGSGPAAQVGAGANGLNVNEGAYGRIVGTTTQQPTTGVTLKANINGDMRSDFGPQQSLCSRAAVADGFAALAGGSAMTLSGIGSFVLDPGATFIESANDTAQLVAVAVNSAQPTAKFALVVDFTLRVDALDANFPPPGGSPKLELATAAYVANGGPIDPTAWHYYQLFHGTATGLGDYAGAVLDLTLRGPAFQVGVGGNGRNANHGGSASINAVVLANPTSGAQFGSGCLGDLTLDLETDCVEDLVANQMTATTYGIGCQGFAPAIPTLNLNGSLALGSTITLEMLQAPPTTLLFLVMGMDQATIPIGIRGCNLLVKLPVFVAGPYASNPFGGKVWMLDLPLGLVGTKVCLQVALTPDLGAFTMSNGVEIKVE